MYMLIELNEHILHGLCWVVKQKWRTYEFQKLPMCKILVMKRHNYFPQFCKILDDQFQRHFWKICLRILFWNNKSNKLSYTFWRYVNYSHTWCSVWSICTIWIARNDDSWMFKRIAWVFGSNSLTMPGNLRVFISIRISDRPACSLKSFLKTLTPKLADIW